MHTSAKYQELNACWRRIFTTHLSNEEKQARCRAVFDDYIGQMALQSVKYPAPTLRFFTAMLRLQEDLNPAFAHDEYGATIIRPFFALVWDWVRAKWDSTGLPPDEILKQRMSDFPRDHELIAFFATEPEISGQRASGFYEAVPGIVPWFYKTLTFTTVRDAIEVRCEISPSLRQLAVRLAIADNEVFYADVELAGEMRLEIAPDRKVLVASVDQKDDFALQIEPHPRVAWRAGAHAE